MVDGCMGSEATKNDVMADLSAAEATAARDALCKVLYARLFTWVVNSINERIKVRSRLHNINCSRLDLQIYVFCCLGEAARQEESVGSVGYLWLREPDDQQLRTAYHQLLQ